LEASFSTKTGKMVLKNNDSAKCIIHHANINSYVFTFPQIMNNNKKVQQHKKQRSTIPNIKLMLTTAMEVKNVVHFLKVSGHDEIASEMLKTAQFTSDFQ
jgi:hypothetical protein